MKLDALFTDLATAFDPGLEIERFAAERLRETAEVARFEGEGRPLPDVVRAILAAADAHHSCRHMLEIPFDWVPPKTSTDPLYLAHSGAKVHVELLGPDGLVQADDIRLGIYGMPPGYDYGLRTHLAEEVFVMLAGGAHWKRGDAPYRRLGPGERVHHPSMMPHANRTTDEAFMSVYVWRGDVSNESYDYRGHTGD